MRNDACNVTQALPWQTKQTLIHRVTDFANDKQVVLTQQIIHIANTSCLRIFYRHYTKINFASGNGAKHMGKTAIGDEIRRALSLLAEINVSGLISKGCALTLEGDGDNVRRALIATEIGLSSSGRRHHWLLLHE